MSKVDLRQHQPKNKYPTPKTVRIEDTQWEFVKQMAIKKGMKLGNYIYWLAKQDE